jgi:hypothetical protein
MFGLAVPLLALAAVTWVNKYAAFSAAGALAIDYWTWVDAGHRFLTTGTPYQPFQAAPYTVLPEPFRLPPDVPFMYPPPFALVCAALTAVPGVLWWAVPFGIVGWCLYRWRPAPWTWPLLALGLASQQLASHVMVGGTSMWMVALVFAGLRWGWPAVLIVLKPSLAPFALVGIRRRSWWVAVPVMGAVSLVMLPLWPVYLEAMRNAADLEWWYSLADVPIMCVPLVAWMGRGGDRAVRTVRGPARWGGQWVPRWAGGGRAG